MGSSNPISDIVDTVTTLGSNIISTGSDAIGKAVNFVTNNADVAIPVIAAAVTGDPLLAADTFGSSTAADIAANEAASNLANAGIGAAADTFGSSTAQDILSNQAASNLSNTIGSPFGSSSAQDILSNEAASNISNAGGDPFGSSTAGDIAANTAASNAANAAGQTLQQLGVNTPPSLWDKFTGGIKNLVDSGAVSNVFDSLGKVAPLAGAGILGKLAYSDQARINDSIVKAYNDYLSQQAGIRSGFGVTAGPQLLNYTRNATPLAQAPLRTVADVVNIPKKADGGILSKHSSNMLNEYMNLRNRLKKYKTGGRVGYAMGSPMMPMQQGMVPDKEKLKQLFTKRPDILKKVLALKAQHESGQSSMMGLKKGGRAHYADGTEDIESLEPLSDEINGVFGMSPGWQNEDKLALMKNTPITELIKLYQKQKEQQQREEYIKQQKEEYIKKIMQNQFPSSSIMGGVNPQTLLPKMLPQLARGGISEIDYRDKGGYVPPIGKKERADDIPAMLSNNEFVFTANAVRNAGGGDVKAGAKKMYALMKQLEKGMA